MTDSLIPILVFVCAAFSVVAKEPENDDPERILHDGIWCCLHDLHGEATGISAFANRMEKEWGISKSRFSDLLLETARDEREDRFARKNAIVRFCELAPAEDFPKVSDFFSNTNSELRMTALRSAIVRFPDVSDRVDFARKRLEWLQEHPEFRHDASTIMIAFYNGMVSSGVTGEYKNAVLTFYRNEAENPRFGDNAYAVLSFLDRHDPVWNTNERRVDLLRKWKDDPELSEDIREFMQKELTVFSLGDNSGGNVASDKPVFGEDSVEESSQTRTEPVPAPAEAKPAAADKTPAEAPQEPAGFFSAWIAGAAVLALAAALAYLVVRRNRRR